MKRSLGRRVLSWLLCVLMLCACLPVNAFAAGNAEITVGADGITAAPGDTVTIPVNLTVNPGIAGMTLTAVYDENVFELAETYPYDKTGTVWPDSVTVGPHIIMYSATNTSVNGMLFNIKLKVKEDATEGTSQVTVKCRDDKPGMISDENKNAVPTTIKPCTVTITGGRVDRNVLITDAGDTTLNGTGYDTVAEALAAIQGSTQKSGTIKLYKDVSEAGEFQLADGDNIILDLNGKTLTCSGDGFNGATTSGAAASLTIRSSDSGQAGKFNVNGSCVDHNSGSLTLNIESGSLYNADSTSLLDLNGTSPLDCHITGGYIESKQYVLSCYGFDMVSDPAKYHIYISGGTFITGKEYCEIMNDSVTITGGRFKTADDSGSGVDVDGNWPVDIPDGYTLLSTQDSEGYYNVVSDDTLPQIAENSRTKKTYAKLQTAVNEAAEKDEIDLNADTAISKWVEVAADKDVTIDLNGHTVTLTNGDVTAFDSYGKLNLISTGDKGVIRYAPSISTPVESEGDVSTWFCFYVEGTLTTDNIEIRNFKAGVQLLNGASGSRLNNLTMKNISFRGIEIANSSIESITNTSITTNAKPEDGTGEEGSGFCLVACGNSSVTLGEGNKFVAGAASALTANDGDTVTINDGYYEGYELALTSGAGSTLNINGGDFYAHSVGGGYAVTYASGTGVATGGRFKHENGNSVWGWLLGGNFDVPSGRTKNLVAREDGWYELESKWQVNLPESIDNGTLSCSANGGALEGDEVTIDVTPSDGYSLKIGSLKYTTINGNQTEVITKKNDGYTFTMPADGVNITAEFTNEAQYALGLDVKDAGGNTPDKIETQDEITVDVKVTSSTVYNGYDVSLTYDKNVFKYVSGADPTKVDEGNGTITFIAENIDDADGVAKTLASVKFKAIAASDIPVSFKAEGKFGNTAGAFNSQDAEPAEAVLHEVAVELKPFTVSFTDADGGNTDVNVTVLDGNKTAIGDVPSFTRTGYNLDGWTIDGDTTVYTSTAIAEKAVTANVTYKAKWSLVNYKVTHTGFTGSDTANYGTAYEATIDGYNASGYTYSVKYTIGGGAEQEATIDGTGKVTIPGASITGDIVLILSKTGKFSSTSYADYVGGYSLIVVHGANATGYTYNNKLMYRMPDYDDTAKGDAGKAYAYIIKGAVPANVDSNIGVAASDATPTELRKQNDVNASGKVDINDAIVVYRDYNTETHEYKPDDYQYMPYYLRADLSDGNADHRIDNYDVQVVLNVLHGITKE